MTTEAAKEYFERLVQQYATGEKEAYDSAAALQEHTDKMFTWLLGLMGAGLIAGVPLLKNAPQAWRASALAPWLIGIVVILGGRAVGAHLRSLESLWHFEKAVRIRSLLLKSDQRAAIIELGAIINREDAELQRRHVWSRKHGRAMERLFYASLALFGVGMITVVAVATAWP